MDEGFLFLGSRSLGSRSPVTDTSSPHHSTSNVIMSVLDRVKAFLPELQKANVELEAKIKLEGTQSVRIDGDLGKGAVGDADAEAGDEAGEKGTVALEFALGDFDEEGKLLEGDDDAEEGEKADKEEGEDDEDAVDEEGQKEAPAPAVVFRAKPSEELFSVASTTRKTKDKL